MAIPPDQPTQRLPPASPPVHTDPVAVAAADELVWRDEVRSRLASLVTGLTIALVVSFIALGVALWALFGGSGDDRGADPERVRALQERVSRLERLGAASRDAVAALQRQQRDLAARVTAVGDAAAQPAPDLQPLQTAIEGTQQAVEQLDERIASLEQSAPAP
jgi:hypothetical protein